MLFVWCFLPVNGRYLIARYKMLICILL